MLMTYFGDSFSDTNLIKFPFSTLLVYWQLEKLLSVILVSVRTFGEVASIFRVAELDWNAFNLIVQHPQLSAHVRPLVTVPSSCEIEN